ncbi:uncharacterized protein [Nyctibius grandis]|uniref:uncharacterized protein isoform X2 n=1 Tax=Nyctibius grandis TaxID=48427 RepID=UPI0035BBF408
MGQPTFRSGLKLQSWSRGALPQAAASLSRLWAAEKEIWLFPKTSLQGLITSTSGTQESWTLGLHFSRAKTRRPAVRVKINTLFKRFNCLTPRKPVVLRRCLSGMTRFQWRFREPGVELQMWDDGGIESAFHHVPPYPVSKCSLANLKAGPVIGTSPKWDCWVYLRSEGRAVLQPPTSRLRTTPAQCPPL